MAPVLRTTWNHFALFQMFFPLYLNNLSDSSFLFSVEILGSLFFHLVE
jgi:hypothetical protein